ncbi:MAG TPA: tRNA (N(6)-L-threonylcarbamoyladenosine(37)-C(2))-methylthiotransferase MtaB [Candidatus Eisenbacteria bacterium]
MAAPRVSLFTLGCRLNQHDTAAMRADLAAAGFVIVAEGEPADWAVVNTCTVTHRADQEARQLIRRVARSLPGAQIAVTGCYAQRAPEEVAAIRGVTAVLGIAERERIGERLRGRGGVQVAPGRAKRPFHAGAPVSFGRTRALLKVQDGCDSFCAFCIVPFVRGRSRSLPLADALEQTRRLLDAGFHEIVLTGADLGRYGWDLGDRSLLLRLLDGILSLGSGHRVRLSSIEPNKVEPALLERLGGEPRLCRHLHLPLQSGAARVLSAMRRAYTPGEYLALCERAASRGPVGIGADVIVGFPGETEADFEDTFRLLASAPVTYLHVFRYSARPGTAAARLGGAATPETVQARSERLRALGEEKARAFRASLVGAILPVLPEPGRGTGPVAGLSDVYVPVRLTGIPASPGLVRAAIAGTDGDRLVGDPLR